MTSLIAHVSDAVVITDPAGDIIQVNPAFTRMTGYRPEEVIGKNSRFLKSGKHDAAFYKELWDTIASGRPWHGELINRRKDGTTYIEDMTIAPVGSRAGVISGYIATKREVTERLPAGEPQNFLAAILASSEDAIFGKTLAGRIRSWNHSSEALLGYTAEEVIGQPSSMLFPPDLQDQMSPILANVREGQTYQVETVLLHKQGARIEALITGFPIRNVGGAMVGSATIVRDIRERKRAQERLHESEAKYRAVFQSSRDAILVADAESGMLLDANPAALALLGHSIDEIRTLKQVDLHSPEDVFAGRRAFEQRRSAPGTAEHVLLRRNGDRIPVEIAASPMRDARGRELIVGIVHDLTERRTAEAHLRESEERFRIMADGCPMIMWVTDEQGSTQFVNRSYREFFDLAEESGKAYEWTATVHSDDLRDVVGAFTDAVRAQKSFTVEARVRRGDGQWRWMLSTAAPRFSATGEFLGHVGIAADVTERRQVEEALRERTSELETERTALLTTREELRQEAMRDGLTGLLNRVTTVAFLQQEIARAQRQRRAIAVLLIDLDHFKQINDTHGHLVGDAVLRETARRIAASLRPYDCVGRYGGEEFLVVLPIQDLDVAIARAEKLRRSMAEEPVQTDASALTVTCSIGLAWVADVNFTTDELIRRADDALYAAKRHGRNRVMLADASLLLAQ